MKPLIDILEYPWLYILVLFIVCIYWWDYNSFKRIKESILQEEIEDKLYEIRNTQTGKILVSSEDIITQRRWMEGDTMLTSDGYSLIYHKNKNQIVICLPQTIETATNTYEQCVDRKTDVTETELAVLLDIAKLIFHRMDEVKK